jgi:CheY-like chemotaxis protein
VIPEHQISILIVEDAKNWQKLLFELLQEVAEQTGLKITIDIARRYSEAAKLLEKKQYRLVTVDHKLPDVMNARPVLDRIAATNMGAAVVVVSGPANPADVRDFFKDFRINEFFWKRNFDPRAFRQRITDLLALGQDTPIEPATQWDSWNWRSSDGMLEVPDGVLRSILRSLDNQPAYCGFIRDHRDTICQLAVGTDDRRTRAAATIWKRLWLGEEGLPYLPLIDELAKEELSGNMYPGYRDHVVHSVWTYFLGLYLYAETEPIRAAMLQELDDETFLSAWKIAALFHDIGYTYDKGVDSEKEMLAPLIVELQKFTQFPLRVYLEARGFSLSERDEDELVRLSGRTASVVLTIDSFEYLLQPGRKKPTLGQIESHAISTQLGKESNKRPLQSYYNFAQQIKPDGRQRFRDHGMLSAMILLHQFSYLDHSLRKLKGKALPSGLSRSTQQAILGMIEGPVTLKMSRSVECAAAAIALHNVDKSIWTENIEKSKQSPYNLSLADYHLDLEQNPLAFLLALADVLQCWDRPRRSYSEDDKGLSVPCYLVNIRCDDSFIHWSVRKDSGTGRQQISPREEIQKMAKYLSYTGRAGGLASIVTEATEF